MNNGTHINHHNLHSNNPIGDVAGCLSFPLAFLAMFFLLLGSGTRVRFVPLLGVVLLWVAYIAAMVGSRKSEGPVQSLARVVIVAVPFLFFLWCLFAPAVQQARE